MYPMTSHLYNVPEQHLAHIHVTIQYCILSGGPILFTTAVEFDGCGAIPAEKVLQDLQDQGLCTWEKCIVDDYVNDTKGCIYTMIVNKKM